VHWGVRLSEPRILIAHSEKQDDLIFSDSDITIGATGTQWGKSQGGSLWLKRQIHTDFNPKANFIIGAPTYKILQQSALPYFLEVMDGFGKYKQGEDRLQIHGGGSVYMRTETDPDSVVGIPNVKAGWLDEAGKLRLYFIENYLARIAAKGAKSLWTTSPYGRNWIFKNFIKPALAGRFPKSKVNLIQAASWENPYHELHDPVKRAEMRKFMDPKRFNMLFGGEWGQMIGLVYDCFDEEANQVEPFDLPSGTQYFGGVDWGYTDPFVLTVRAITSDGRHYQVSEFYKTGLTISDMIEVARQKKRVFHIERFYCDPSQPGSIEEFNRAGLPAVGADNDIRRGIDLHYELLKTRKLKYFRGLNPYTLDELDSYHYPEPKDLGPDQDSNDQLPVGQNDHCLDTGRYITISTYRSGFKSTPKAPQESLRQTREQRTEWLKRRKARYGNQTENWS
jgi:hypothetical protein